MLHNHCIACEDDNSHDCNSRQNGVDNKFLYYKSGNRILARKVSKDSASLDAYLLFLTNGVGSVWKQASKKCKIPNMVA